jgi:hypothetical protein
MKPESARTLAAIATAVSLFGGWPAVVHADPAQPPFPRAQLAERSLQRRAVEAVIWGLPAVNFDVMAQAAARDAKGGFNRLVYWSRRADWKNQTLTPNADVLYVMPFIDTREAGPIVLEIPPADEGSITGTVMDAWQQALEDVGPAGVDQGKGGKYLILPPGFKGAVPPGYISLQANTFRGYALLRSVPQGGSDEDLARAVRYLHRIRLYPLSQADHPSSADFVDAADVVFDATIPYDLRFFQALDRIVQAEPWQERDKVMSALLKTIGIEKGRPFAPDPATARALEDAAQEARAWLQDRLLSVYKPFYAGRQWFVPAEPIRFESHGTFETADAYGTDARATLYSFAFSSIKHPGAGQYYEVATRGAGGELLDGAGDYRLVVPANVPVKQYWSATVYDLDTGALIREVPVVARSSFSQGLAHGADGSVELRFGPKAPAGGEANWIPTRPGGRFFVVFRFYGPERALFDKSWQLPDIERATE